MRGISIFSKYICIRYACSPPLGGMALTSDMCICVYLLLLTIYMFILRYMCSGFSCFILVLKLFQLSKTAMCFSPQGKKTNSNTVCVTAGSNLGSDCMQHSCVVFPHLVCTELLNYKRASPSQLSSVLHHLHLKNWGRLK